MSKSQQQARQIFERAVEIGDISLRQQYVEQTCGEDHELRVIVNALLQAASEATGLFDSAGQMQNLGLAEGNVGGGGQIPQSPQRDPTANYSAHERHGALIAGKYKLLENIGEGGMGSVWVAEQAAPVKRRVAIKMIKPGMDSKQVLARFEAERQALALMDHPNIAKVFDGGVTEQGRPYFVMEYVKGIPFTEYCDQARVSLKERLQLFMPVCSAVQHAHQKGIVHRDLKPSNILICLYDGKPVPKVIDFGLAKALHQSLSELSVYTAHGVMVGTPLYMSPEQAEHNNLDIDTRTDIYSLGVILYELLVGSTPLEKATVKEAALNEVLRLIKEVDPPRPSTRLSGSTTLPSIAAQRSIEPNQLRKSLSGDLDWIVMKALEKERSRRYETAVGLSRDIERFLNDEAVEACPPSRSYRLKRLFRKHRSQFIAAGIVLLTLLAGIAATSWQAWRATRAEHAALESERKAIASLDQATRDRDAKAKALESEAAQRALAEKQRALAQEQQALAEQQREAAEQNWVDGILRPIGFNTTTLDEAELQSFIDWSALSDPRLKIRVLKTALADSATALRISRRAESALQSCIGTNPVLRRDVIALLTKSQNPDNTNPQIQIAATRLAVILDVATAEALAKAIDNCTANNWDARFAAGRFNYVADLIQAYFDGVDRDISDFQTSLILKSLVELVGKTTESRALEAAGNGLTALAAKLNSEQTERAWQSLIELIGKTKYWAALEAAGNGLTTIAANLDPEQTERALQSLVELVGKTTDGYALEAAGNGLTTLAAKLDPEQTERALHSLVELVGKTSEWHALEAAGNGLTALAAKLDPEQTERAWQSLVELIGKTTNWTALQAACNGLTVLAAELDPAQTERALQSLIELIGKTTNWTALEAAGNGLTSLAAKLDPEQTERAWQSLVELVGKTADGGDAIFPAGNAGGNGLTALAGKLEAAQTERVLQSLVELIGKTTEWTDLEAAGKGLTALAAKLDPAQTERVLQSLVELIGKTTDADAHYAACNGLTAIAAKLDPEQTERVLQLLVELIGNTTDGDALEAAGNGLTALAARLDPAQTERALKSLIEIVSKTTNGAALHAAGNGLTALADRLNSVQTESAWQSLVELVGKTREWRALAAAGSGLTALAVKLDTAQTERAWQSLIELVGKTTDGYALRAACNGLTAIAAKLDAAQTERALHLLIELVGKTTDRDALRAAGSGLTAIAAKLDAAQTERAWQSLIQLVGKTNDEDSHRAAGSALTALAAKLDPAQTESDLQSLVELIGKTTDSSALEAAGNGLSALLPQVDPQKRNETVMAFMNLQLNRSAKAEATLWAGQLAAILIGQTDLSNLAQLLRHPGAREEIRDCIVRRLEEVALHGGQPVFSTLEFEWHDEGELDDAAQAQWQARRNALPPRKFRTVYDAIVWLAENRPDIDLESAWKPNEN